MRAIAILAACLTVGTAHIAAAQTPRANQTIAAFMPATPGQRACYTRSYDAEHLRAHPKQRVTAMTFFLRAVGYDANGDRWILDPAKKFERVEYQFALSVTQRGSKRSLAASGYCPDNKDALCIRECDGGGATLEKVADADALMIRLMDGGIRLAGCAESKATWLKPGADDKVFRLEKAAPEQCAALEKAEFGN